MHSSSIQNPLLSKEPIKTTELDNSINESPDFDVDHNFDLFSIKDNLLANDVHRTETILKHDTPFYLEQ